MGSMLFVLPLEIDMELPEHGGDGKMTLTLERKTCKHRQCGGAQGKIPAFEGIPCTTGMAHKGG